MTQNGARDDHELMWNTDEVFTCDWRAGVAAALLVGSVACGSDADRPAADAPTLEASPWLLTSDTGGGGLQAHRFRDGKLEQVLLDAHAIGMYSWSPTGRWLTYQTVDGERRRTQWMRRFDGEVWHDAQLVTMPEGAEHSLPMVFWSPTTDQLLYTRAGLSGPPNIGVATPRDDGSLATYVFEPRDRASAYWTPDGERITLVEQGPTERHVTVIDVGRGADVDAPWPSREIVAPSGRTFDDLDSDRERSGIPWGTVSTDGRWIVFVTKDESSGTKALQALSTTGHAPPRTLEDCPVVRDDPSGTQCWPSEWASDGATLFLERTGRGESTLEAWSLDTGRLVSLGTIYVQTRLPPRGRRLLAKRDRNTRGLVFMDLADVEAPQVLDVPTTDLPSFRGTFDSPDGRWLLLRHANADAVWIDVLDLSSPPPWQPRELYRKSGRIAPSGVVWSPRGTFVLLPENTDSANLVRAVRIDLETLARNTIEVPVGAKSADGGVTRTSSPWQWVGRVGSDDRTLAIGRDGELALWWMDSPLSTAAKIDGVPESVRLQWVPAR